MDWLPPAKRVFDWELIKLPAIASIQTDGFLTQICWWRQKSVTTETSAWSGDGAGVGQADQSEPDL